LRATHLVVCIVLSACLICGCEPEVGSDEWCEDMLDKPKGDWTANEAKAFAENCIFKSFDDD
jgi:hypothetical protein